MRRFPTTEEIRAEKSRRRLSEFIRYGWHVLEETTPLEWNWHIEAIADHLQAAFEDWVRTQDGATDADSAGYDETFVQRIQNLLINIPPGTAKSRIVGVMFPAWVWLHRPSWRAIFLSANPRVAVRDSIYCRDLILSEWYQSWFKPEWSLTSDQNAKTLFRNSKGGFRQAMGFDSSITGDRADALVFDDPHDADEVNSDDVRQGVLDRWDTAIANRVNDLRYSLRIGVMQRLHEEDLSGHVLKKGGWVHLRLPMEFEREPECKCPTCKTGETPIGWHDPRTEEGELLFPKRFPKSVLADELARLTPYGYAGQMQQRPSPAGGSFFEKAWFKIGTPPRRFKKLVRYWDIAGAAPGKGDWTVGVLMGEALPDDGGKFWILSIVRFQKESDERDAAIVLQAGLDRTNYQTRAPGGVKVFVEQVPGIGKESIDDIIRQLAGYSAEADRVSANKTTRAEGYKSQARAGNVMIADDDEEMTTNLPAFLHIHEVFPNGKNDDDVDAASGAFRKVVEFVPSKTYGIPSDADLLIGSSSVGGQSGFGGDDGNLLESPFNAFG